MKLLNGNTSQRVRSSDDCTVTECGCASTEREWLQFCDAHYADWRNAHDAAAIAHKATLEERLP